MCGIHFIALKDDGKQLHHISRNLISKRGPDAIASKDVEHGFWHLSFTSSVLHLRGQKMTCQPLVSDSGHVFCWNGEAYRYLDRDIEDNDARSIFEILEKEEDDVLKALQAIEGPWAMVYYNGKHLYFGKDCLGRRSLLFQLQRDSVEVASVAETTGWKDMQGVYKIDLGSHVLLLFRDLLKKGYCTPLFMAAHM